MKKRADLEGPIHKAVLHYLRLQFPRAVIHHSPNEVDLRGKQVARAIAKSKSLGMLVGFPDLLMIHDGRVVAFEVKAGRGILTDAQRKAGATITANGGNWAVVRSVDEARAALVEWGILS